MNAEAATPKTYSVAQSSTGMIHRAYGRKGERFTSWTAQCATDLRWDAKAVRLRGAREVAVGTRPEGRLCKKCFGA